MITIQVCIGSACHLKGSYNIINKLQDAIAAKGLEGKVMVKAAFCLGKCTKAVSVKVDNGDVQSLDEERIDGFLNEITKGR